MAVQAFAAHLWALVTSILAPVSARLGAHPPLPRWLWAGLIVLAGYVAGQIGGRVLSVLSRLVVLAAALVIGWEVLHGV